MTGNDSARTNKAKGKPGRAAWWRPVVLVVVIAAIVVVAKVYELDQKLDALGEWIDGLGAWGPLAFIAIYIVATVAAVPGSVLTVAAGVLFGTVVGVICVSIASTVGASLAFLLGRYIARDTVAGWLERKEQFRRLDQLTEDHGELVVALTRLVPLFPFNLLNYGFSLTRVRFWTYVFWSWLCMLPFTVVYVAGTDAIKTAIKEGRVPWLLVGVVAATIVILALLVRHARGKLRAKVPVPESPTQEETAHE